MPIHILMPALSPTMSEGKLAKWLKREGDAVASGDAVAEIETDKATMEVEVFDDGVLGKILVAAGTEGVAVNTPIAVILEEARMPRPSARRRRRRNRRRNRRSRNHKPPPRRRLGSPGGPGTAASSQAPWHGAWRMRRGWT
ncbi:MAG TPA: hypothetical protein HPP50_03160 [Rhodospirillaceae bacterium]|nr:hypothetical protein [Rhodospirillaceae bacterium]